MAALKYTILEQLDGRVSAEQRFLNDLKTDIDVLSNKPILTDSVIEDAMKPWNAPIETPK